MQYTYDRRERVRLNQSMKWHSDVLVLVMSMTTPKEIIQYMYASTQNDNVPESTSHDTISVA